MSSFFPGVRPVELIPGDPVEPRWLAGRLGVLAGGLGETAHDLAAIDAHDWTGPAADAFHQAVKVQPGRYANAATSLNAASTAVLGYANALEAAQQDASRAISAHQEADNATAAWQHRQQAAAAQLRANTANTGHPTADPPTQPSSDPGDQGRNQAETVLQNARLALDLAATRLRTTLQDAQAAAPNEAGLFGTSLNGATLTQFGFGATAVAGLGGEGTAEYLKWAKPVQVSGYWRGKTWVNSYRRSARGQIRLGEKLGRYAGGVSLLAAGGEQAYVDWHSKRYGLGEKLARSGTALGIAYGEGAAVDVTITTISSTAAVSALADSVALAAIPGVGEVVIVVVVAVAAGYLINRYIAPVVTKEVFRAEHWAFNDGARDAGKILREDEKVYADDGRAIYNVGRDGVHALAKGTTDVANVADEAGSAVRRESGALFHGIAHNDDVQKLRTSFVGKAAGDLGGEAKHVGGKVLGWVGG